MSHPSSGNCFGKRRVALITKTATRLLKLHWGCMTVHSRRANSARCWRSVWSVCNSTEFQVTNNHLWCPGRYEMSTWIQNASVSTRSGVPSGHLHHIWKVYIVHISRSCQGKMWTLAIHSAMDGVGCWSLPKHLIKIHNYGHVTRGYGTVTAHVRVEYWILAAHVRIEYWTFYSTCEG
jgi:hypothetical protein